MNPFDVRKIIIESHRNGERLIVEDLSRKCGVRIRHGYLRMSHEMFECKACGGFPRHWIKGLKLHSYITLWFYKPPKDTDFSPVMEKDNIKSFAELTDFREIHDKKEEK